MSAESPEKDLVVLAADKDIEMAMRGILGRPESLQIRSVSVEYLVHPEHDPGCARRSDTIFRLYVRHGTHAIVVMDHEGSGLEAMDRADLESQIEENLARSGWGDRAAAIVIAPELENWVWSDSPHVDRQLGWTDQSPALRRWLDEQGWWPADIAKPARPKEAMRHALHKVQKAWSSAIHGQLAQHVSLKRCSDPAFQKLVTTLRHWFPGV
ncbi:MAG: hypothetical protein NTW96_06205 [Planctomycetia bacterium]|nr:hypothetical protein [Planctomycetia bacterium]